MTKEAKAQVKVQVGIEAIWKALAKDLRFVLPRIMPGVVRDVQVIEGDGGLGTVFLFNFGSDVSNIRYQKEKLVDLDESLHQIGLQVVEGGHLNLGFSSYKTTFQLIANGDSETLINAKVVYEVEADQKTTIIPEKTLMSSVAFIEHLENYLLNPSI
ncbi:phytohormone-binding protein CSBP-like [Actinidia eriantha]|uniref:phytohormone-binding protein CSBP-like n=1 Tax=Actinidia eriantha TaxID=165200 RepID=UPI00258C2980|nr:phytohormone-binding protein CSBP-like [Actinidia eriantha]